MGVHPFLSFLLFVPVALSACGGDAERPAKVVRETPGVQLRRVATRWGDTVEEEGFLSGDPNGVVQFRVVTARTFVLGDGAAVTLHIERDETFQTNLGAFRCKAKGDLSGTARYAWQADDPEVRIETAAGELPRSCDRPGFPVTAKALGSATLVFVLRGDQLLGKTSARDRTVLLPLQ
jgi:hypothetical protein